MTLETGKKARELIDFWFGRRESMTTPNEIALAQSQLLREISNELSTLNDVLNDYLIKLNGEGS